MSISEGMPTMTMPVTPANGGGNGFGFGGDGAWFLIILFLFAFCGWGGNGWGNNGNSGGVVDGYVLASDFSNIERKMDSMGRYSRDEGKAKDLIERMMQDTDDPNVKEALRQAMHVVENG